MKPEQTVADIMQPGVVTVNPETPLADLEPLFTRRGIHHLLVEAADGELVGIISTEDLARRGTTAPVPRGFEARHLMSARPVRVKKNTSLRKALDIFLENRIRCLPVVDELDVPIGTLTPYDFLDWISREWGTTGAMNTLAQ